MNIVYIRQMLLCNLLEVVPLRMVYSSITDKYSRRAYLSIEISTSPYHHNTVGVTSVSCGSFL
jgi:hypothetical protein